MPVKEISRARPKGKTKVIMSISKLIRIVVFLEFVLPLLGLIISASLAIHNHYFKTHVKIVTLPTDSDPEFHAIKFVKEILTLSCYYFYMIVKFGLGILLWKGYHQRDLYKLSIWLIISVFLLLCGVFICFIAWVEVVSDVGLTLAILTLQLTVSVFSSVVVIHFIRRIKSRAYWDFDDCMKLRFEAKDLNRPQNIEESQSC